MSSADTITKPAPASVFLGNEVVNAVVLHADSTDLWLCLKRPASPQRFARTQLVLDGGESVLVDGIIRTCEPWGAGHCVRLSHLGASPTLRARLAAFAAARDSKPPVAPPVAPPVDARRPAGREGPVSRRTLFEIYQQALDEIGPLRRSSV